MKNNKEIIDFLKATLAQIIFAAGSSSSLIGIQEIQYFISVVKKNLPKERKTKTRMFYVQMKYPEGVTVRLLQDLTYSEMLITKSKLPICNMNLFELKRNKLKLTEHIIYDPTKPIVQFIEDFVVLEKFDSITDSNGHAGHCVVTDEKGKVTYIDQMYGDQVTNYPNAYFVKRKLRCWSSIPELKTKKLKNEKK